MPPKKSKNWKAGTGGKQDEPDEDQDGTARSQSPGFKDLPSSKESDAPFVTDREVREPGISMTDKSVGDSGFLAEIIAASGQQLHETEYYLTGDRVFLHTPAKERMWVALGKYVESVVDPTKYGPIILLVAILGMELGCLAVYAKHRADAKPKPKGKGGKKGKGDEEDNPGWKA